MESSRLDVVEDSSSDVLGPVDYVVVEFPADKANFSGEMATELDSLVDRKLVRVLDLVILRKNVDGSVEVAELREVDESNVGKLLRARSGSGDAARRGGRCSGSARRWSRAASQPCSSTRTAGPDRSPPRCAGRAANSWPTVASRPRRCWPRSKRKHSTVEEGA